MANTRTAYRLGWALSSLVGLLLLLSAVMKLRGGPGLEDGFTHMGVPMSIRIPLGILEIAVAFVYLVPATSVLGAILVTGYLGGAVMTHWRVGDQWVTPVLVGVVAWLALWLREERLKPLLPLTRS